MFLFFKPNLKKLNAKLAADAPKIINFFRKNIISLENQAGQAMVADANNAASTTSKEEQLNILLKALIASISTSTTGLPIVAPDAVTMTASKIIIEKLEIPAENGLGTYLENRT